MEGLSIWSMIPKSDPKRTDAHEDEPQESAVPEAAPSHRASAEISQPRRRRVKPEMEKKHLQHLLKQEFKLSKPEERIEIMTHKIELVDNKRPELPGVKPEGDSDEEYYDAVPEYTVYTWGRGNDNIEVLPMDRLGLKQVECATDHNIGLTDMGEVMTWGSFSGETANNERNSLENGIERLYSGPTMMAAVKKGKLWLWGTIETNFGKLDYSKPSQILFYDHNDERYYITGIKHMSIGPTHLAVLAANNMIYTIGSNLYKELVHKKSSGRFGVQMRPIYFKKDYLHNVKISAVGCGPNYTVMGYGNHFVIWGRFNGAKCKEEVFELEGYRNDAIQDFICHANFLLVLTDNGNVFGFGDNTTRMMGIGDNAIYAEIPMRLNFAHNDKSYRIVSIRSGGEHFVAIDDTGRVWTWGRCEGGRLGYFPLQYSQDESSMSQDSGSGSVTSHKSDKSATRKKRRSSHRSSKKLDTFLENGYVPAVAPNNVQTVPKRVEQMEGQFVAHVSCTATGCMALGRDRVFGEYLHKLAAKTENWMPTFLEKLFSLLENRHVDQNILKVPGNVKLVNATRDNIDKGLAYDISKMDTEDLIALLKLYLSELPNPLLSSTLTEEWNKIKRLLSPERRLEKYHKMLSKLPTAHKEVLLRLLKWCYLLSVENRARTKLFPKHIAKVFGPYLAHVKNPVLINNFIGILEDMIDHTPELNVKSPPPRPLPKPKSRSSSRSASPVRSLSPSEVSSSDSDSSNRNRPRSTSSPTKSSSSSSSGAKKPKPLPLPKPKNRPVSPAKELPKPPTKTAPSSQPKSNSVPKPASAGSNSHADTMNTTNFDSKLNSLQSQFDDLMKARQEYEAMKKNQPNPAILQLYQHQARQQSSLRKAVEKQREQAHKRIIIEEEEPSDNESSEDEDMRREHIRPKSPRNLNREDSRTMRANVPKRPLPSGFQSRYNSDRLTASQRQELEQMLHEEESKQKQEPKIYFDKPPARPQPQPAKNGRPVSQQVSDDQIKKMIHGLQHGFKPQPAARPAQQVNNRPSASNHGGIVMPPIPIRPKKPRTEAPSQVHVQPPLAAPKKMVNNGVMQHSGPNVNHTRPPVKQPQSRVPPAGTNKPAEGRFVVQNNQQFVKFGGKLIPRAVPEQKKEELPSQYEKKPVDYDGLEKVIYPALTQLVQTHPNLRQETIPHLEHLQECFERLEEVKPGLALSFVARVFETLQEQ